jgi:hypothetical protein
MTADDPIMIIDSLSGVQRSIMANILPPSIPNDSLVAKCSPRGAGNGGNVVWSGHFAGYNHLVQGAEPKTFTTKRPAMTYVMDHWTSTNRNYRTIDEIVITNLYCGVGKGWDIVVCGTIIQHESHKTDAQREAEKLLDGKC